MAVSITTGATSVKFTFTNNQHYLTSGEITYPLNSLSMLIDESDMVTFKNTAGDIVLSLTLGELDMTKAEITELYEESFVGGSGGGGDLSNYYTKSQTDNLISAATSGKQDTSGMTAYTTSSDVSTAISAAVSGKQDTLVSQTNIKSINGTSLLGSGDLTTPNTTYESGNNIQISGANNSINLNVTSEINCGSSFAPAPDIASMVACVLKTNKLMSNDIYVETFKINKSGAYTSRTLNLPWSSVSDNGSDTLATKTADLGGLKLVKISQTDYDNLQNKDANTLYVIQ